MVFDIAFYVTCQVVSVALVSVVRLYTWRNACGGQPRRLLAIFVHGKLLMGQVEKIVLATL